jgi:uncharacterized membrane protein
MAYPIIAAPYGLKPINLLGGQVFAGSTRMYPIQYGYNTNILYGDFVKVSTSAPGGMTARAAVSTGTGSNQITGIFLGCSYTNPLTKQKQFAQYWPASTLAGDAVAYVCDDPDTVFKAVVCSATTVVASGAKAMIGTNLSMINNAAVASSLSTGNSANAVLAPTATPVTSILPVRCVGVVEDTAIVYTATGSSSSTTITLTGTGLPAAITVGTSVAYLAPNGQVIETGSFVTAAASAGATSITINAQPNVLAAGTDIPAASTIIFTMYPEILVRPNLLIHGYLSSTTA